MITQLVKVSPDPPTVNTVYEGDKIISGSIELLGDDADTQTKVYAQIGSKTYKGTVEGNGDFTIKIPAQKEGAAIKLWGVNKAGRGPLIKIIVNKK